MSRKIGKILQEYIFILSVICTIIGILLLGYGIPGTLISFEMIDDILHIQQEIIAWSPYILIVGIIIFLVGIWYLWLYLKNKKFLLKELKTTKRSEFIKLQPELEEASHYLPLKYRKMLSEKEASMKRK